jgi:glutathione S-transferase
VARIDEIWSGCRRDFGAGGNWLFGDFSIADAMFAPVLFRFHSYGAALSPESQAYLSRALEDPLLRDWQDAAAKEGHPLPDVDQVGA